MIDRFSRQTPSRGDCWLVYTGTHTRTAAPDVHVAADGHALHDEALRGEGDAVGQHLDFVFEFVMMGIGSPSLCLKKSWLMKHGGCPSNSLNFTSSSS